MTVTQSETGVDTHSIQCMYVPLHPINAMLVFENPLGIYCHRVHCVLPKYTALHNELGGLICTLTRANQ